MHPLVLASASPRRLGLLQSAGVDLEVRVPHVDETPLPGEDPVTMVERLACAKRDAVITATPDGPNLRVIAADTVVVVDGEALGKPGTPEMAVAMLSRLSGRTHHVVTGVAVAGPAGAVSTTVTTEVTWRPLSVDEIKAYVATGEPLDKAGGYGIQSGGEDFVTSLVGSRDNVVGLPVATALELMATVEIANNPWRR